MKSRSHDDAMVEYFRRCPGYARTLVMQVLSDGDPSESAILSRQLNLADLYAFPINARHQESLKTFSLNGISHGIAVWLGRDAFGHKA